MAMNKKTVFAAFFVACLMIASLGALTVSTTSEASSTHYTDINKELLFNDSSAEDSAKTINKAVGSEVCYIEDSTLVFTQSCSLRAVGQSTQYGYFMAFQNGYGMSIGKDVVVTIAGGADFEPTEECPDFKLIEAFGMFFINGGGELKINLADTECKSTAIYHVGADASMLSINDVKLSIHAINHVGIVFEASANPKTATVTLNDSTVTIDGKYAMAYNPSNENGISIVSFESSFTFEGTDAVFDAKFVKLKADKTINASMNYRGTDLQQFDENNVMKYQYITTEEKQVSSLLIPLIVVLGIACVLLFGYVFLYNPKPPWEQEKINAEKAKKRAENEAKRLEMEKKRALEKAEIAKKRAEEAKAKEEARKTAEAKKAEERRLKEEQKAKERAELEKKRAEEAKAKEEARKAAEAKKAEERRLAEERKAKEAAERKAAEEKRAAEKKAAAERKAEEEKARKAIKAKEAAEAKQREEAKKAEKAKKEAAKKK